MTLKSRLQKIEAARRPDWKTRQAIELLRQARQRNGNPEPVPGDLTRSQVIFLLIKEMPQ